MREVSVSVSVGDGAEFHNHDIEQRKTLSNTKDSSKDTVIEVVPYDKSYKNKIKDILEPYLKIKNETTLNKYEAAMQRYREGKVKRPPNKNNYKSLSIDEFYNKIKNDTCINPHTHKKEQVDLFQSVIIGVGDTSDRMNGVISKDEAVEVLTASINDFINDNPNFKVLGATIHLDEGYEDDTGKWMDSHYHAHIDYFILTECEVTNSENAYGFIRNKETALKDMGYEPEQSIINESDKVPIRFNAFRNRIYKNVEGHLKENGLTLMYGATSIKNPERDATVHKSKEDFIWQKQKSNVLEAQHQVNLVYDKVANYSDREVSAINLRKVIDDLVKKIKGLDETGFRITRDIKGNKSRIVPFSFFEQMKTTMNQMMEAINEMYSKITRQNEMINEYKKQESSIDTYKQTQSKYDALKKDLMKSNEEYSFEELKERIAYLNNVESHLEPIIKSGNDYENLLLAMKKYFSDEEIADIKQYGGIRLDTYIKNHKDYKVSNPESKGKFVVGVNHSSKSIILGSVKRVASFSVQQIQKMQASMNQPNYRGM